MEIVDLVCRGHRSPKQRESYVCEGALLRRPRCPIFALHGSIVGRRAAKRNAVSLIVGTHSRECAASRHSPFEMENM